VLDGKRYDCLEQDFGKRIVVARKTMAIVQQTLKLSVSQVSEYLKESSLRLTELHNPGMTAPLIAVIGKGLVEQMPNPGLQHKRVRVEVIALIVTK
jgi:hypothetical protein